MDFITALLHARVGDTICRPSFTAFYALRMGEENKLYWVTTSPTKTTTPPIVARLLGGESDDLTPEDITATDWEVVEES